MKTHKNMNNIEISNLLRSVSAALEIKGENKFKSIAYEKAADAIEHLSSEVKDIWDDGKLEEISGIGKSMAEHLDEIFKTGKSKHFEKIFNGIPDSVFEFLKLPGIGPKNAVKFSEELNIKLAKSAISNLEKAAKSGKIAKMPGFGEDSQESVIKSIQDFKGRGEKRILLSTALDFAEKIINWMEKSPEVERVETLGSTRRKASTVGDLDFAAATRNPQAVLDHFSNYPDKLRVLEKGIRTASVILPGNMQADLMVETPSNFGSLLQHFTGSKHHNIALREYAIKNNWKVSDYGITKDKKLIKFSDEKKFYKALKLDWIPPELRQDTGEIQAALRSAQGEPGGLPDLVELSDIKGDLHMHSNFDIETSHDIGSSSMKKMVEQAKRLNYEYIAFTEHNPSQSKHNQKQITNLLKHKQSKINTLNKAVKTDMKIFNSLEIDILPDGSLPVSDEGLDILDFAVCSIHSSFKKSRAEQTKRVLRSLSHPKVKIFAHPTARKLNEREGVELDWEKIFEFCLKNKKHIEINSAPQRLDLPDFLVQDAVKAGVKLVISTDSHDVSDMNNMKYGVFVARRGWCGKKNILNSLPLSSFREQMGI